MFCLWVAENVHCIDISISLDLFVVEIIRMIHSLLFFHVWKDFKIRRKCQVFLIFILTSKYFNAPSAKCVDFVWGKLN